LSTVLTYGLLTLKAWAYRVFMVWLPVKVVLSIVVLVMPLSLTPLGAQSQSQPPTVTLIIVLGIVLQVAALMAGFLLVKRGNDPGGA
jgi:hypothetical protein